MARKTVLFVHLLNNNTGSPKVLRSVVDCVKKEPDIKISLLTSRTDGFLSCFAGNSCDSVRFYDNGYRWTNCRPLLAFLFLFSQIRMFFFVLLHRFDVIYINTVVPFGAALAAKLRREKIIYHVHEVYINPNLVKRFYIKILKKCADRIICVSEYVRENLSDIKVPCEVIYNPIEKHDMPDDVEKYLVEMADNFMNVVFDSACSLAKHRNSDKVEVGDFASAINDNFGLYEPSIYSATINQMNINSIKNTSTADHKKRLE